MQARYSGNSLLSRHTWRRKSPGAGFSLDRTARTTDTEAQAAEWLIRLEAEPSAATLSRWRHWLSEDARRHVAYVRLESGWRQTDCLQRLRPLDGAIDLNVLNRFPGVTSDLQPPRAAYRRTMAHWVIIVAATLAAVLMCVWLSG